MKGTSQLVNDRMNGIPRREFLALAGAAALSAPFLLEACRSSAATQGAQGPIKVASLLDRTGAFQSIGTAMADATTLAVESINKKGGVLGQQLQLQIFDTQSDNAMYTQFARQIALDSSIAVVMGGILSASREAIRPIFDSAKKLYFYNEQYEGGVCDKHTFVVGDVPTQQMAPLVKYGLNKFGKKFYTIAADYNWGHISVSAINKFISDMGGTQLGVEFIPLDVTQYGTTIDKIQRAAPDVLMALTVGGSQQTFYRQWKAAGLKSRIPIVSPSFGTGDDTVVLDPSESQGVVVALHYFQELDNPTNKQFVQDWHARFPNATYPRVSADGEDTWTAWHLWAMAVNKAGTTDTDKVIQVLESGLEIDAPSGKVRLDGGSHHAALSMSMAVVNDHRTFDIISTSGPVDPTYEMSVCNLVKNPSTNQQFSP